MTNIINLCFENPHPSPIFDSTVADALKDSQLTPRLQNLANLLRCRLIMPPPLKLDLEPLLAHHEIPGEPLIHLGRLLDSSAITFIFGTK